ncbi:MAG: HAD family hydrolase [Bacillota bacterium]
MSSKKTYRALLIDLDGTLLELDIQKFITAYIDALSDKFKAHIDKNDFANHLFGATSIMVKNGNPDKTNEEVFYEDFCRRTRLNEEIIRAIVEDFYLNEFPGLSCWGRKHPHASAVIKAAKAKKLTLVLATNPIFPAAAILERLSWSGFSEKDFSFITTMENMNFCKPRKEYYAEIADQINCAPEECLMAGNDTLEDLIAAKAGMDTYLVDDFILKREEKDPVCDYRGSLKELANFLTAPG